LELNRKKYSEYERKRTENVCKILNEGINEEFDFDPKFEKFNEEEITRTAEKIVRRYCKDN